MRYFYERSGRRRLALLRRDRPGQPAGGARARARVPARVRERPGHRRPLLGALVLRPRAGGACGRERRGACSARRRWRSRTASSSTIPESNSGLWLGCVMGELANQGRDKLTYVVSDADLELRPLGRAADRRVHRQARQGHPAGGGRAARRPGGLRQRPRVRLPAQRGRAGRGAGREIEALGRAGPPHRHLSVAAAPPTSGGSSSSPSSPPRWRAGRSGSTRSTSRTCRRRRTTPARILKEGPARAWTRARSTSCSRGGAAAIHRDNSASLRPRRSWTPR